MSNNRGNVNDTDRTGDIISWVIVIILMFALPPLGWILLLVKLGVFANRKVKNNAKTTKAASSEETVNKISKRKKSRLDKKTGKGLSVLLLLVSIGLFITGISVGAGAISGLAVAGLSAVSELIASAFWLLGGFVTFFSRNIIAKRFSRYKNYYAYTEGRDIIPIQSLAQIAGVPAKTVIRDLQAMINNGYLDAGTYIDNELECLVLSAEAADKLRMDIIGSQNELANAQEVPTGQYAANLAELREVNSFINDEAISKKVSRLEELTEKIFNIVEENPQKKPQLKRFMSYYLPTTLKLVRSYATLEKQGVKGENIMSTKESIGNILDTLSTGFEQQLDQLFKSDAIDIATDINVLENLMQQDGLTSDKSEFHVAQAGG